MTGQGNQAGAERIRSAAGPEGSGRGRHHSLQVPAQALVGEWLQVRPKGLRPAPGLSPSEGIHLQTGLGQILY